MATQNLTPQQQNFIARQNLLTTGISMIKRLQPVNARLGDNVKIPLLRMGIMTGVILQFSFAPTIAVLAPTPSPIGPWNLAQLVTYTDFASVQRTRTNGYQLWAAQSFKQGDALGSIPVATANSNDNFVPALSYNGDILSVNSATNGATSYFSLYVPMAYDPSSDLTGAVLTQTNVGEHYITVQLANSYDSTDPWAAPYLKTTSTFADNGITIEAFQCYIQPQNMDANSLPILDLSTIYGFEGNYQSSANIASGQSTYINYPNNRAILSTLITFENNSTFSVNGSDLNLISLVANSNTTFKEMTPRLLREMMRNMANFDAPNGTYYLGSRRNPILTQLYANVQAKMDVKTANAGLTQFITQFEVQYPSGAPLPGITVAA